MRYDDDGEVHDVLEGTYLDAEERAERAYRRDVEAKVEAFYAEYDAETERLVAEGVTDRMSRAMCEPRICHVCAQVYDGGGECRGTEDHPHRTVVLYASNE